MATAFLSPVLSATTHIQPVTSENRESIITNGLPKSSFLLGSSDLPASATLRSSSLQGKAAVSRKFRVCAQKSSLDHIPKQFRQENLKDGCEFVSRFLIFSLSALVLFSLFLPNFICLVSKFDCILDGNWGCLRGAIFLV